MNYYVYILFSQKDGKLYTGYTQNINRRIQEHIQGKVLTTRDRRPLTLIYWEGCLNQQDATRREKYLKSDSGKRYIKNRLKNYLNDHDIIIHSTG